MLSLLQFLLARTYDKDKSQHLNQTDQLGNTPLHYMCSLATPPSEVILSMLAHGSFASFLPHFPQLLPDRF